MILELSTGSQDIVFAFDVDSEDGRANSLHEDSARCLSRFG